MAQMPRMKGAVTGNFGKAKVKARPGTYELSKYSLTKKGMKIPRPDDAIQRYMDAYNNTNDQKLKERLIAEHDYEFFNSTQCVDKYGKWHDGTVWRRKWAFKKKGKLSWINQQGYIFLEK